MRCSSYTPPPQQGLVQSKSLTQNQLFVEQNGKTTTKIKQCKGGKPVGATKTFQTKSKCNKTREFQNERNIKALGKKSKQSLSKFL